MNLPCLLSLCLPTSLDKENGEKSTKKATGLASYWDCEVLINKQTSRQTDNKQTKINILNETKRASEWMACFIKR